MGRRGVEAERRKWLNEVWLKRDNAAEGEKGYNEDEAAEEAAEGKGRGTASTKQMRAYGKSNEGNAQAENRYSELHSDVIDSKSREISK